MFFHKVREAIGQTERIQEILDTPSKSFTATETVNVEGQVLKSRTYHLQLQRRTDDSQDVSFEAKPNTVIAFAGPSGGGKSTIFALLERFYQPDSGMITIGGKPIQSLDLQAWRAHRLVTFHKIVPSLQVVFVTTSNMD